MKDKFKEQLKELEGVVDYIRNCPSSEMADIDNIYDDGDSYVINVSMCIRKEDLKNER